MSYLKCSFTLIRATPTSHPSMPYVQWMRKQCLRMHRFRMSERGVGRPYATIHHPVNYSCASGWPVVWPSNTYNHSLRVLWHMYNTAWNVLWQIYEGDFANLKSLSKFDECAVVFFCLPTEHSSDASLVPVVFAFMFIHIKKSCRRPCTYGLHGVPVLQYYTVMLLCLSASFVVPYIMLRMRITFHTYICLFVVLYIRVNRE